MESPSPLPSPPSPDSLPSKLPSRTRLVSVVNPICLRLKSIVNQLEEIASEISEGKFEEGRLWILKTETSSSIYNVDIELNETCTWISTQIDRSRVNDPSLKFFIDFYKYTKELVRIVEDVSSIAYSDMKRVLEEHDRGLMGVSLSHSTIYSLKEMRVGLNRALNLINSRSHA